MKIEFECDGNYRHTGQRTRHRNQGVFLASTLLGGVQPVFVALLIFELESINRLYVGIDFLASIFIQKDIEASAR